MNKIDNQILHSGVIDERAQLIGWLNPARVVVDNNPAKFNDFSRGKDKHFT